MSELCDYCKAKPATIYVEKNINGVKTEHNLCPECAFMIQHDEHKFSFNDMLKEFLNITLNGYENNNTTTKQSNDIYCKNCNMTYCEFKQFNKFGCSSCYSYFRPQIKAIFTNIQKGNEHIGKVPKTLSGEITKKRTLSELKSALANAINSEEYEIAATIRDKIRELQGGGNL